MEEMCQGWLHWSYGFLGVVMKVWRVIGSVISLGEVEEEIKEVYLREV